MHAAALRRYSASTSQATLADAYLGSAELLRGYYGAVHTASQRAAGLSADQVCCGACCSSTCSLGAGAAEGCRMAGRNALQLNKFLRRGEAPGRAAGTR